MVFSSIPFLFFFLPGVIALYFCSGRLKNIILLLCSLFFYAWGEGIYLLLMLGSIVVNYSCGRMLDRNKGLHYSRPILLAGLIFNLGLIGFYKYANFLSENLNHLLNVANLPAINLAPVHLPIGISFFTFQAISYLVDVYRGVVKPQRNLINLGLYISLFPQLIAGPIVRYHDIARSLTTRTCSITDVSYGIRRFLLGLSKKVLLANPLGLMADQIYWLPQTELNIALTWLGALCYTFQIYYDFSGYSDMAIGLGRIFGFKFLENFNYPYISKSIQEFWRRWHISLSTWFRDYLYIPLGGNRHSVLRTSCNLFVVFLLCGLWHGASWTFICWGLFHGFFLVIERVGISALLQQLWSPLQWFVTFLIIVVGWVFFRAETLPEAIYYLQIMFGIVEGSKRPLINYYFDIKLGVELFFAALFSIPLLPYLLQLKNKLIQSIERRYLQSTLLIFIEVCSISILAYITYLTVISLAAGVYNPFIYFRF